jgi:hypothetical protein
MTTTESYNKRIKMANRMFKDRSPWIPVHLALWTHKWPSDLSDVIPFLPDMNRLEPYLLKYESTKVTLAPLQKRISVANHKSPMLAHFETKAIDMKKLNAKEGESMKDCLTRMAYDRAKRFGYTKQDVEIILKSIYMMTREELGTSCGFSLFRLAMPCMITTIGVAEYLYRNKVASCLKIQSPSDKPTALLFSKYSETQEEFNWQYKDLGKIKPQEHQSSFLYKDSATCAVSDLAWESNKDKMSEFTKNTTDLIRKFRRRPEGLNHDDV